MFYSILFRSPEDTCEQHDAEEPKFFRDLNLDYIFRPIIKAGKELRLEEYFYSPLRDRDTVLYRQDVMRELEGDGLCAVISDFSKTIYETGRCMCGVRSSLVSSDTGYLEKGHMLDCAERYCKAVSETSEFLSEYEFASEGLAGFSDYLDGYCRSEDYLNLSERVRQIRKELSEVNYCMLINNGTVRVRKYEGQEDQSAEILDVFDKFRQGNVKNYLHDIPENPFADHIEGAVLKMVRNLYKDKFGRLERFCSLYCDFEDKTILRFSREINFYLSWLAFVRPLRGKGLPFSYPEICTGPEHIYALDMFDAALAAKEDGKVIKNDFSIDRPEQIIVITGPNQGGKTTFARAVGQMHYFASLGLCVPGSRSALYLPDRILTHFGREEKMSDPMGKLRDDLTRLYSVLSQATERSLIIINEIFSSTTVNDAVSLGKHLIDSLSSVGSTAVIVTFLDEIASYGNGTVSMMSTVNESNPAERTFRIIRKPPDGLAYAAWIARRHGLTYGQLSRRLREIES